MSAELGQRFAAALAAKDEAALLAILDPAVDFRALTPGRAWESTSAEEVVREFVLGAWFEPDDHISSVERVTTDVVGGRNHVSYRLRVDNADGAFVVEQQAYFDAPAGAITLLRVLCSGYRPIAG